LDATEHLVSLGLQVVNLLAIAGYIKLLRHPRVRRHRLRRWLAVASGLGLASFIFSLFFAWGAFINDRHPTRINGGPLEQP
jgi:hypothetical protein